MSAPPLILVVEDNADQELVGRIVLDHENQRRRAHAPSLASVLASGTGAERPRNSRTRRPKVRVSIGLEMYPAHPAARVCSRSPPLASAFTATILIFAL